MLGIDRCWASEVIDGERIRYKEGSGIAVCELGELGW